MGTTKTTVALTALVLVVLVAGTVMATPYVPLEEAERAARERRERSLGGVHRAPTGLDDLDEIDGYLYPPEYFATLSWLTTLQVGEEDPPNLGGMREGEEDLNVIQTDNTQEALRDWAFYGRLTGDTSRFRQNIMDAWTYTLNFPAWEEEGGGDPNYYRVHNAGWGLVATMEYTKTYGDSSFLWYGDSCASYLDHHRLGMTGSLNPLSAGYGAGALYQYAVWRDNAQWETAAQQIGTQVKNWIDADPSRLNDNETWAMSGGTALWGVVTSLFSQDSTGLANWVVPYYNIIDTYSGPGQWNNSWTIWYGHAWNQIHSILGDSTSYANAVEVIEYMLDQVHLDDDAGVPATEDHYYNDQSWTSAYLIWYGLEPTFQVDPTAWDAATWAVTEPLDAWPLIVGNTVNLTVQVVNGGLQPMVDSTRLATVSALLPDGSTAGPVDAAVPFGQIVDLPLPTEWAPDAPGEVSFQVVSSVLDDARPGNDTLTVTYDVVAGYNVSGTVTDPEAGGEGVEARIEWVQRDTDPPRTGWTLSEGGTGAWSMELGPGEYDLQVLPLHTPYPRRFGEVSVVDGPVTGVNFTTTPAPVLLVSELNDEAMELALAEDFVNAGTEACIWSVAEKGLPTADTLGTVELAAWFAGGAGDGTFPAQGWPAVGAYLDDGGKVLLSGSHWLNAHGSDPFLAERFAVGDDDQLDMSITVIFGDEDHPVAMGDTLMVTGVVSGQLFDDLQVLEGGDTVFFHPLIHDAVYGVATEAEGVGRTLALSFGVEAINSENFTPRWEAMEQMLTWFGVLEGSAVPGGSGSGPAQISTWSLAAHPNPFNPTLQVVVGGPAGGKGTVRLYDLLGRQVARWQVRPGGGLQRLSWDGSSAASGVYLLTLEAEGSSRVRRVTLLK